MGGRSERDTSLAAKDHRRRESITSRAASHVEGVEVRSAPRCGPCAVGELGRVLSAAAASDSGAIVLLGIRTYDRPRAISLSQLKVPPAPLGTRLSVARLGDVGRDAGAHGFRV